MIQEEPGCGLGGYTGKAGVDLKGAGLEVEDAAMDLQGTALALTGRATLIGTGMALLAALA